MREAPSLARSLAQRLESLFEHDVFISYAREEREFVEWLRRRLRYFGFHVTFDADLQGGEPWREAILRAIARSVAAVVVETPSSHASEQVHEEVLVLLQLPLRAQRALVPLLLHGEGVRAHLRHLQWIDFRDLRWNDPAEEKLARQRLKALAQALRHAPPGGLEPPFAEPPREGVSELEPRPLRVPVVPGLLRRLSVRALLAFFLLLVSGLALARGVLGDLRQRQANAVVARLETAAGEELEYARRVEAMLLDTGEPIPAYEATREYRDTHGALLARDVWRAGRLAQREFFRDRRLVARDRFDFKNGMASGRIRTYFLAGGAKVAEHYLQDGILYARYVQLGPPQGDAPGILRDAASIRVDLPPPAIVPYR